MEEGTPTHVPVLTKQVIEFLQPKTGQTILDLTVGYGGHAHALLAAIGGRGTLIGIDRDRQALAAATERLQPFADAFVPVHANFVEVARIMEKRGISHADGIVADLGVSSPQMSDPARGFGFAVDSPLDMRMDPSGDRPTAERLVNELSEADLADLIHRYGQDRYARRIARLVVRARCTEPIRTTGQLAALVKRAYPHRRFPIHPATRTFQALRIGVNDEIDCLARMLDAAPQRLAPRGRMVVISFHSGEDKVVKEAFRAAAASGAFRVLTKKPVVPDADEVRANPRARSAKLRAIERN